MTTTLDYLHQHAISAAYALLPAPMRSAKATAMLLAITLQESPRHDRVQLVGRPPLPVGPAHGLWQFEKHGGVWNVLNHHRTRQAIRDVLLVLRYSADTETCHDAITDNDVLAAAFARCNLWTDPRPLPEHNEPAEAWQTYLRVWKPGKPHPSRWTSSYTQAWALVTAVEIRK